MAYYLSVAVDDGLQVRRRLHVCAPHFSSMGILRKHSSTTVVFNTDRMPGDILISSRISCLAWLNARVMRMSYESLFSLHGQPERNDIHIRVLGFTVAATLNRFRAANNVFD